MLSIAPAPVIFMHTDATQLAMRERLVAQQVSQLEELVKVSIERNAALQHLFRKTMERYLEDQQHFVKDIGDPDVVDAPEGIADAALDPVDN